MRTLAEQFDDTLDAIYGADKAERDSLMSLILEFYKETDLIESVFERMNEGEFKMGDNAKEFFSRCADDLFKKRLRAAIQDGTKKENSISLYHPLWGASWWTK